MDRRDFIVSLGLVAGSLALAKESNVAAQTPLNLSLSYPYTLPELGYSYSSLTPFIDAQTMEIHHSKHHQAYITNLNAAVEKAPSLKNKSLIQLLSDLSSIPEEVRTTIRNNGGGHLNHTLFWKMMEPHSAATTMPLASLAQKIDETFGDFEKFKEAFNQAGLAQFGSGWVWLVLATEGSLKIMSTSNQDSPYSSGFTPIFGNDLWEHAYYLSFQNKRNEYLNSWWNVVNWKAAESRFLEIKAKPT